MEDQFFNDAVTTLIPCFHDVVVTASLRRDPHPTWPGNQAGSVKTRPGSSDGNKKKGWVESVPRSGNVASESAFKV